MIFYKIQNTSGELVVLASDENPYQSLNFKKDQIRTINSETWLDLTDAQRLLFTVVSTLDDETVH